MNNMKINRLKIVNYKLFQNVTIEMNENINIFVGENDSGKSTILEALSMVLTGKINGSSVANRLNLLKSDKNSRNLLRLVIRLTCPPLKLRYTLLLPMKMKLQ